jgi:hypothetical protein
MVNNAHRVELEVGAYASASALTPYGTAAAAPPLGASSFSLPHAVETATTLICVSTIFHWSLATMLSELLIRTRFRCCYIRSSVLVWFDMAPVRPGNYVVVGISNA